LTFAYILQDERDYSTAYFGKWHLNGDMKPGWSTNDEGRDFGFENIQYRFNRGHWKYLDKMQYILYRYHS
jgi:uncharacterized sulfatase